MDDKPASVIIGVDFAANAIGGALAKRFKRQREEDVKLEDRSTWIPTAEKGWQGPKRKAGDFVVGGRFTRPDSERHANGAVLGKRSKLARRMLRGKIMGQRTDVKKNIVAAHREIANAGRLAENSHEKRRMLEQEADARRFAREERHRVNAWWASYIDAWFNIGNSYGRLTAFAQAGMR